jgi:hypothetical protein
MRAFLHGHAPQFTSFHRVIAEYPSVPASPAERLYEIAATLRLCARRSVRALRHG